MTGTTVAVSIFLEPFPRPPAKEAAALARGPDFRASAGEFLSGVTFPVRWDAINHTSPAGLRTTDLSRWSRS
jgi:hypothetical protein